MHVVALLLALLAGDAASETTVRERIEANRPTLVTIDGIHFGEVIVVVGTSPNPNAVGNFVENLKADPLFQTPEVVSLSQREGNRNLIYDFELRLRLRQ